MKSLFVPLCAVLLYCCTPESSSTDPAPTPEVEAPANPEPSTEPDGPRGFPFGESLDDYTRLDRTENAGGDCETVSTRFQNDDKILVIDSTNCYEYGKSFTAALFENGQLMELQEVRYAADDPEQPGLRRVENVYTFRPATPLRYYRSEAAQAAYEPSGGANFQRMPFDVPAAEFRTMFEDRFGEADSD